MRRFRLPRRLEETARRSLGPRRRVSPERGGSRSAGLGAAAVIALAILLGVGGLSGIALSASQRHHGLVLGRTKPIPPPPLSYFRHASNPAPLSARQRRKALLSRRVYRDLAPAAALALARRPAGVLNIAAKSFYEPLMLSRGERIVRFLSANEALVRQPSRRRTRRDPHPQPARVLIARSTMPMTVGKGSHARPVTLILKHTGSRLAPIAPLVPLSLSPDETRFTGTGVSLTLEGAHPTAFQDLVVKAFSRR
jgi:hypothetical protein